MNIILIGMKACGKSTIGKSLAKKLKFMFLELDEKIENYHLKNKREKLSCRKIYQKYGKDYFRSLETETLRVLLDIFKENNFVLSCGGGTVSSTKNQKILSALGSIIFLDTDKKVILKRILINGIPAFFPYKDDPARSIDELLRKRMPIYKRLAALTLKIKNETVADIVNKIIDSMPVAAV